MYTDCFRRREFEAVGICPDGKFIETALDMSDIFRPIADKERLG